MRLRAGVLLSLVLLGACGGSTPIAHTNGSPTASSTATGSASPTSAASPTASAASMVHCAAAVPAGDNLVIGTVVGDPTIVVRDIQDPAHARNLCTFDSSVTSPTFVSGTTVAYETTANEIVKADLGSPNAGVIATYATGIGTGQYAFSPDGKSMSYVSGNQWHLVNSSGDLNLTTLPAVPARVVNPQQDDSYLAFSPDGQYLALFQTFHTGGSGATAPDQIRRAADGGQVFSTSGATMAVWASVPSRLFFRDGAGNVKRWDASSGVSTMTTLPWIRPQSSPDGRWIAYTFPTPSGVAGVGFYSVRANSVSSTSPPGRTNVRFLTNDLVFYIGEKACSTCFGGQPTPTGVTYIYSIAGASEISSRLSTVDDAWPRVSAPAL